MFFEPEFSSLSFFMPGERKIRLYFDLILACLLWGSQHPFLRRLSLELPPVLLNATRFGIALLCILPFALRYATAMSFRDKLLSAFYGLFGIGLFGMLAVEGVRLAGAVHLSLFVNVHPVLSACLAPLLIREKFLPEKVWASLIGLFGVALIMTDGFQVFSFSDSTFAGDCFLLVGALVFSVYTIYGKAIVRRAGGLGFTAYSMLGGTTALCLGASLVTGFAPFAELSSAHWAELLYVAVFTVAIAWWLWFRAIGGLGVSTASIFVFITPVSGVLFSALFFGEQVRPWTWAGGALVLTALFVSVWRDLLKFLKAA